MKLNKEQKQKIILGAMLMCGVIYATDEFLLSPLANERKMLTEEIAKGEPRLREMRGQIARTKGLQLQAPEAEKIVAQVNQMIPDGAPIAWFPPRVSDFFRSQGMDRASARLTGETPEKDLVGYRRLTWSVEVPAIDFSKFGAAVSQLENTEPLFEVSGFEISASGLNPALQRAAFTIQSIIKL